MKIRQKPPVIQPAGNRMSRMAVIALLLVLGACSGLEPIQDLRILDQNPAAHLNPVDSGRPIMDARNQLIACKAFQDRLFAPWRRQTPEYSESFPEQKLLRFGRNPGYGENRRLHDAAWIRDIARNADMDAYPNACFPAITIRNTDIRALPTHKPHFTSFQSPGQGYPFDNLQESAMAVNTPVFLSHISRDRAWVLAESHYCLGWIPAADVARTDEAFIQAWQCGSHICMVKDEAPVCDESGTYHFKAPLGSIFPLIAKNDAGYRIRIAVPDENRRAVIKPAAVEASLACGQPMAMTTANVARVAMELSGEPYGWGGILMNRDCSAMIKDLFAPFGIWLPRNSSEQAEQSRFSDLRNLPDAEKKTRILMNGVPFATLLWFKGHIMLYIGGFRNEPLVFHNTWGVPTKGLFGKSDRAIIGCASVTTLAPGRERRDFDRKKGTLLQRVERMIFLDGMRP
ncbi:MAG: SH3 domain-containing protein [Desulfobacterales bacterium]|nr:SH3 domain-containing protein [Desulfobacterales bacterium]